jgi:hypothetical protein
MVPSDIANFSLFREHEPMHVRIPHPTSFNLSVRCYGLILAVWVCDVQIKGEVEVLVRTHWKSFASSNRSFDLRVVVLGNFHQL